jgi:hypothetical protein
MKKRVIFFYAGLAMLALSINYPLWGQSPLKLVWTSKAGDIRFGYALPEQTTINHKLGLRGNFDFDGDGFGEFVTMLQSSDVASTRDNNIYLFEADGDNSYALRWSHKFTELTGRGNGIAVGDLDGDTNPEIICLLQRDAALDNLFVFELDPATKAFPDTPTATWNTPRAPDGRFRAEVDIKVVDFDNDGRQEMILNAFDGLVIASLSSPDLSQPTFVSEYENFTELVWVLAMAVADLDNTGTNELVTFAGWGLSADYYFNVIEAIAPGLYNLAISLSNTQVPDQMGCYSAMLAADLDNNSFPEIYYADTNGSLRSIVLDGNYFTVTPEKFHLLGSVGSEVLTMTAFDKTFYLATSSAHTVYAARYLGGAVTDPASFKIDTLFTIPGVDANIIFKFVGGKDMDGDTLPDYVLATAGHDSTKPTLYVLEATTPSAVTARPTQVPAEYKLAQNYPNPIFSGAKSPSAGNPSTTIEFVLPINQTLSLRIYDTVGREVRTLILQQNYPAGRHTIIWDGTDNKGGAVASGQYIYRLEFGGLVKSRVMTLVK